MFMKPLYLLPLLLLSFFLPQDSFAQPCSGEVIVVEMYDTFGDGWNGGTYAITDSLGNTVGSGGLAAGSQGFDTLCLPNGCYTFTLTVASFPAEVNWVLTHVDSVNITIDNGGGANYSGVFGLNAICPVPGCTNPIAINYDPSATIDDGSCILPLPNDSCVNGIGIPCGGSIAGTTVGSTPDAGAFCGTSNTAGGVWFQTIGTGQQVTASLCTGTNYDSKLSVYSGDCAALACIDGNDDACGTVSEVNYGGLAGTVYHILVHGFGATTGDFTLSLTCSGTSAVPLNDSCSAAEPIQCDSTVTGSTLFATTDGQSFCGTTNSAPGVWYQYIGTGDAIVASMCTGTSYDSKLTVYEGSCGALTCVGGDDDGCSGGNTASEVAFNSVVGSVYYLLVHGFGTMAGDYSLTLSCNGVPIIPPNDSCVNANPIFCGSTITDSTIHASPSTLVNFCGTSNTGPGVWFQFQGTNDSLTLSTCNAADFDTKIQVFSGTCASLTCVDGNDDFGGCTGGTSQVGINTSDTLTYWVHATGFGANTGTFSLTMDCNAYFSLVDTVSICPGDSALIRGNYQSISGLYIDTIFAPAVPDTLLVTFLDVSYNLTYQTDSIFVCPGDSAFLEGAYQTMAGTYTDTVVGGSGCATVITSILGFSNLLVNNVTTTICTGDTFIFNGTGIVNSGFYSDTITGSSGCDSILNLNLTVTPAPITNDTLTICPGDSAFLAGAFQTMGGIYTDTITTLAGCDSIANTLLVVNSAVATTYTVTLCNSDSVLINGSFVYSAGTYTNTYLSSFGCDSVVTVTVLQAFTTTSLQTITICEGDSAFLAGAWQTQVGQYTDSLTASNGCDSLAETILLISPTLYSTDTTFACFGDSAFINGSWYAQDTSFTSTLTASSGCDSIVGIVLQFLAPIASNQTASICPSDSILLGGAYQNQAGTYTDLYTSAFGCDSTVTTTLSIQTTINSNATASICEGDSIFLANAWQHDVGFYIDTFFTASGCDSIVSTGLTVIPAALTSTTLTICEGDSAFLGGNWQDFPGTYTDTLAAANQCDSVVFTTLEFEMQAYAGELQTIDLCIGDSTLDLTTQITPNANMGGTFTQLSGTGLNGNLFSADDAGVGIHEVIYVVDGGALCLDDTATMFMDVSVCGGLTENPLILGYSYFPTPTSGELFVLFHQNINGKFTIHLMDISGKTILSKEVLKPAAGQQTKLNLSGLAQGVYFMQVQSEGRSRTHKVVLE